jgi:hypothetical protein
MPNFMRRPARLNGDMDLQLGAWGGVAQALPVPRMAGAPKPAQPIVLPALTGAPPKLIRLKAKNTTTVYLIDDSGSMYPHTSGDASGIRYAAAQSLVDLQRRSGGGTVYSLHWGSSVPQELVAGPLDTVRDRKTIKKALTIPPTLGGNNLPVALCRALEVTRPSDSDERFIYYVISDGCESVTQATRDAMKALPENSVHMVLVDRGASCSPAMETDWNSVGFASLTRLKTFDTRAMAHQLGDIYAGSLGLQLPAPTTTTR